MQNKDLKVGIIWDLSRKREAFRLNYKNRFFFKLFSNYTV